MKVLLATDGEAPFATAGTLFRRIADKATVDVAVFAVTTYTIGSVSDHVHARASFVARRD